MRINSSAIPRVVQMVSPEMYIKTKVRDLPISECFISDTWKDSGIASILVARKHINGNRTVGYYLADLNCLGIKDTKYWFNVPNQHFEEIIQDYVTNGIKEDEYNIAHNIIYGSLEYAQKLGFYPYSCWEISQFILDEDNEYIRSLVDLEFGNNGKPCYMPSPYDKEENIVNVINTLNANAGEGNYNIIFPENLHKGSNTKHLFADYWDNTETEEPLNPDDIELILKGQKLPTSYQFFVITSAFYATKSAPQKSKVSTEELNKDLVLSRGIELRYNGNEEEIYKKLEFYSRKDNDLSQLKNYDSLLMEYGPHPEIYFYMCYCYVEHSMEIPAATIELMFREYPDYLIFRFFYAKILISKEEYEKAFELLGNGLVLSKNFPGRKAFEEEEWLMFNCAMNAYFIAIGDLHTALTYAHEISYLSEKGNQIAIDTLTAANAALVDVLDEQLSKKKHMKED